MVGSFKAAFFVSCKIVSSMISCAISCFFRSDFLTPQTLKIYSHSGGKFSVMIPPFSSKWIVFAFVTCRMTVSSCFGISFSLLNIFFLSTLKKEFSFFFFRASYISFFWSYLNCSMVGAILLNFKLKISASSAVLNWKPNMPSSKKSKMYKLAAFPGPSYFL